MYRRLPTPLRLARIRERETARYGAERLVAGGDLHGVFEKFLHWAAGYDETAATQWRGRAAEEAWLESGCRVPVLYLEEDLPVEALVEIVCGRVRG
ncbi:MAG: hypothetical protein IPM98_13380 [Lewinellaceae bacterium]|nr:hypothetical protein [Lewinellaceae bacterium]